MIRRTCSLRPILSPASSTASPALPLRGRARGGRGCAGGGAAAREAERGAGEFVKPRSCISIHRRYKRCRGGVMRGYLEGWFRAYRGGAMQDVGYELRRISIPRTSVNRGMKKGRGLPYPGPQLALFPIDL